MVAEILNFLDQINLEWYYKKKNAFQKEGLFDEKLGKIYSCIEIDNSHVNEDGDFISEKRECLIDIDIVNYCWDSDFFYGSESSATAIDGIEYDFPMSLKNISYKILEKVNEYYSAAGTSNNIAHSLYNILDKVKESLIANINSTRVEKADKRKDSIKAAQQVEEEYKEILLFFYFNLKTILQNRYKHYLVLSSLELEYEENSRLVFDVSQDELSALLYILNTAGFFRSIASGDTEFINFCKERFYYSKGVKKEPTKAVDIRRKYNEVKNDKRLQQRVIDKLRKAFQEL